MDAQRERSKAGGRLRSELRGLLLVYVVMAVFSALVAGLCVGRPP